MELSQGGQPLQSDITLVRLCDTPTCVNPTHHHATKRIGYQPHTQRGEDRPNARLTWEIVADIRARHQAGESQRSLAREYHVSSGRVSMIVNRRKKYHSPANRIQDWLHHRLGWLRNLQSAPDKS